MGTSHIFTALALLPLCVLLYLMVAKQPYSHTEATEIQWTLELPTRNPTSLHEQLQMTLMPAMSHLLPGAPQGQGPLRASPHACTDGPTLHTVYLNKVQRGRRKKKHVVFIIADSLVANDQVNCGYQQTDQH